MKIGIFGGTFDPPHTGHLIVAQDAALALGLDRILFVPAARPPHKEQQAVTPAELRARMLELAIAGDARLECDRLELTRSGPSYTVETLRELAQRRPEVEWTLLMGVDQYTEFGTWREPEEIRRMARIGVLSRAGSGGAVQVGGEAEWVEVTRIDISSTALRARVAAGQPIRYLVPEVVERFIFEQRLYSRNGRAVSG